MAKRNDDQTLVKSPEETATVEKTEEELAAEQAQADLDAQAAAEKQAQADADAKAAEEVVVKPAEPAAAPPAHYVSFFEQYVTLVKAGRSDQSIKALNNCIIAMLKLNTEAGFNAVLKLFKESRSILGPTITLQGAAVLPANERATVEIITTIFHIMINNPKAPTDLERARSVVKSDPFVNWCSKKLG